MATRVVADWHTPKWYWTPTIFYSLMFIIYVTNIVIINAKLKVFYFAMSTTLISLKLFLTYC